MDARWASTPSIRVACARRDEHGSSGVTLELVGTGWTTRDLAARSGRSPGRFHPAVESVVPDGTAAARATREGDPGSELVLCVRVHGIHFLTRPLRSSERGSLGVTPARGWRACVVGSLTRQ